ncbi:2-succinyl-5-enolpyruvyl-6-hydroxy-3-cyclohexene-1-carboxylic-acid synthase [Galbitalea soli]|uniref:2-succinyl-5-enolpyruvyl-6-hydroxy-3-cyclohexene-1-carboxylate synthase n=1 Tax=Galbitalea soli TaxID=1268042 RepID=A0A7C9TQ72_9MICO|nr:2-succinyl-5-enolpyruvyl-6-hydroxy-3-cyclohexene-1-carboxylic-acid synthase [Galbitalea soli]NEM91015.1 2-succinyl-5-enolpyruvyl-6-hydroxy-3-cyclohexene-1-carboxylic-acid synthase [Galbitalea soli]NYJ29702.1 2-succinyl-5-enolpyruvyl-6-hydroxy-3-cyclohexene-1-carboxylate synthase [Galbitalea soli]
MLDEFSRLGLRDVVLSPGSRSQALALAAAEYERAGILRVRVRIDERVAGFLGLGLAVETRVPVVVMMTSGTAVANLHPAVLEAYHSGVPLIVLSSDRPESLRGIRSNQTTQQPGIFGAATPLGWDVPAPTGAEGEEAAAQAVAREAWTAALAGLGGRPGPVHVNVAFSEPLSSATRLPERAGENDRPRSAEPDEPPTPAALSLAPAPRTVVVAGTGAGAVAEETARALGAPLLAEVTSGAHFGPQLVVAYRELLDDPEFGGAVERVVVFGHPTLSRQVPALIQRSGVETIVVRSPGADDYNPGHRVTAFAEAVTVVGDPDSSAEARAWLGRWVFASRALLEPPPAPTAAQLGNAEFARRELAAIRQPVDRRMLVEAVWRSTWPHDRLVLGASRLIRVADAALPGKRIPVHANRGLAGIDGTIATALGIALATPSGGTTRVLLGDLAALHDAGALLFGAGEVRPRIQVIVGNDGGGTIFDTLEVAGSAPQDALDRVLLTPQTVDFESLAGAYGWQYLRASTRGELDQALTASAEPTLIEVPLER